MGKKQLLIAVIELPLFSELHVTDFWHLTQILYPRKMNVFTIMIVAAAALLGGTAEGASVVEAAVACKILGGPCSESEMLVSECLLFMSDCSYAPGASVEEWDACYDDCVNDQKVTDEFPAFKTYYDEEGNPVESVGKK